MANQATRRQFLSIGAGLGLGVCGVRPARSFSLADALGSADDYETILIPAGAYPAPTEPYVYAASKRGVTLACADGEAVLHASSNGQDAFRVEGDGLRLANVALVGTPDHRSGFAISGKGTLGEFCRVDGFSRPGLGYGVVLLHGAERTRLHGFRSSGCRHAYSTQAGPGVVDAVFSGWDIRDTSDDGFDSHWGAVDVHHWGHTVTNPGNHGGMIQSSRFSVRNVTVVNPAGYDLVIQPLGGECVGEVLGLRGSAAQTGLFVEFKADGQWPAIERASLRLHDNQSPAATPYTFDDERNQLVDRQASIPDATIV